MDPRRPSGDPKKIPRKSQEIPRRPAEDPQEIPRTPPGDPSTSPGDPSRTPGDPRRPQETPRRPIEVLYLRFFRAAGRFRCIFVGCRAAPLACRWRDALPRWGQAAQPSFYPRQRSWGIILGVLIGGVSLVIPGLFWIEIWVVRDSIFVSSALQVVFVRFVL